MRHPETGTSHPSAMSPAGSGGGRVTLSDVARLARVDRSVVSRVVTGDPRLSVRPDTRARVLQAIEQLHYRTNAAARSLRTARAGALGLLIPDYANPIYAEIIKGAEEAALAYGYVLLTGSSAGRDHGISPYAELLDSGRVDGVLLAGAEHGSDLEAAAGSSVPSILLNRRLPGATRFVTLDDERAAELAVDHLVQLGHAAIAHVAGPPHADTATRRRKGYSGALAKHGIAPQPGYVVAADYSPAGGARALGTLLELADPPTAVVVANIASAIGVLDAARRAGAGVPETISVVAVHDLDLAGFLYPGLTTVKMPLRRLGARGVELLTTLPGDAPVQEVLKGEIALVQRASTARPAAAHGRRRHDA